MLRLSVCRFDGRQPARWIRSRKSEAPPPGEHRIGGLALAKVATSDTVLRKETSIGAGLTPRVTPVRWATAAMWGSAPTTLRQVVRRSWVMTVRSVLVDSRLRTPDAMRGVCSLKR